MELSTGQQGGKYFMNMSFWKELFDLITDLPQHPDALVKIIALLLGLSIIFCALYSHIVGIFTIKYMVVSIISALYFIFSVIWMLYYIDNTIMGMMPGFVLILLVLICIVSGFFIIRKEERQIKKQANAAVEKSIMSETTDR